MQTATAANSSVPAGILSRKPLAADELSNAKGHAAGVLFVAPDGDVLLLRRAGTLGVDNFVGHWALPGGGVEAGETPEVGADREGGEEMGVQPEGKKKLLDQRITPNGMVFHTFAQPVGDKFVPKLNAEHSGYAWAPLEMLPQPLHPAVAKTLTERLGTGAEDMKPEDWTGLRDGFLKWTAEEESEPEHAADALALDEAASVREYRKDGSLFVKRAHISKAGVNPYRGKEIPKWQELGLEPDRIYQMLRDPEELAKAAPTFNNRPLLNKHIPVSADNYDEAIKPYNVGNLGSDAVFEGDFLDNSLAVYSKNSIGLIESDEQKEISCGYHYRAEMTAGNFRGSHYDGVMRDIVGNHAALVKDGRAGPDVVVGDSTENLKMTKPTRIAALTLGLVAASISPMIAMDSQVTLPKDIFSKITTKNFKDGKTALLSGVRAALVGKLRPGMALDATMEGLAKAIDAFADMPEAVDEPLTEAKAKEMDTAAVVDPVKDVVDPNAATGVEAIEAALKEKGLSDEDIAKICAMMPKAGAMDADETPEEKAARLKKEEADKTAKDAEMKDMVTKPAMDAALKAHGEQVAKTVGESVTKAVRETERGIRAALAEVRPYVGELPETMAFDSAADVRRHALKMLNVENAATLHVDALQAVLSVQPKAGAQPHQSAHIAMDSATR